MTKKNKAKRTHKLFTCLLDDYQLKFIEDVGLSDEDVFIELLQSQTEASKEISR